MEYGTSGGTLKVEIFRQRELHGRKDLKREMKSEEPFAMEKRRSNKENGNY